MSLSPISPFFPHCYLAAWSISPCGPIPETMWVRAGVPNAIMLATPLLTPAPACVAPFLFIRVPRRLSARFLHGTRRRRFRPIGTQWSPLLASHRVI
ncbi:hypothetical protein C8R44DRAFT_974016, partial [Mycena epipterygia]